MALIAFNIDVTRRSTCAIDRRRPSCWIDIGLRQICIRWWNLSNRIRFTGTTPISKNKYRSGYFTFDIISIRYDIIQLFFFCARAGELGFLLLLDDFRQTVIKAPWTTKAFIRNLYNINTCIHYRTHWKLASNEYYMRLVSPSLWWPSNRITIYIYTY